MANPLLGLKRFTDEIDVGRGQIKAFYTIVYDISRTQPKPNISGYPRRARCLTTQRTSSSGRSPGVPSSCRTNTGLRRAGTPQPRRRPGPPRGGAGLRPGHQHQCGGEPLLTCPLLGAGHPPQHLRHVARPLRVVPGLAREYPATPLLVQAARDGQGVYGPPGQPQVLRLLAGGLPHQAAWLGTTSPHVSLDVPGLPAWTSRQRPSRLEDRERKAAPSIGRPPRRNGPSISTTRLRRHTLTANMGAFSASTTRNRSRHPQRINSRSV